MKFIKKWFKDNQKILIFVLILFVVWQLLVAGVMALGQYFLPHTDHFVYGEGKCCLVNPSWLWRRANFDGIHYLEIARKGYGVYQQAFFPLYPRLIKWLRPFFQRKDVIIGTGISAVSLFLGLFFLCKLVELDYKGGVPRRTLIYLLIFPTAFFFSMIYTESLFLLLVIASFYFARTKRWWLAGIWGALASAARLPGIFLLPALGVEWWQQLQKEKQKDRLRVAFSGLSLLLIPLGLLFYMRFLSQHYGDPFLFAHVQPHFGAGREVDKIILLYRVFWRYLKMLVTVDIMTPTYFVVVLEFLTGLGFLILAIFAYLRQWFSYLVFMALAYITPTLTGTFLSLPRFALILFPGFILLALWAEKYRWVRFLYLLISLPLFVLSLLLFTCGYWIA